MNWLIIVFAILVNTAASALLKWASLTTTDQGFGLAIVFDVKVWGALICYGAAFVLYAAALMRFPLNVAQPIMTAASIILVGAVSAMIFSEAFTSWHLIGYAFLLLGIAALSVGGSMPAQPAI